MDLSFFVDNSYFLTGCVSPLGNTKCTSYRMASSSIGLTVKGKGFAFLSMTQALQLLRDVLFCAQASSNMIEPDCVHN